MAEIQLEGLAKRFGNVTAVHDMDLTIADGEFVVFVGPSGCGKSTTLRMMAGLEDISSGTLHLAGEPVNHKDPKQRNIAMVFQNYAIYPHVTVRKNIGFGLYTSKLSSAEKTARINETAEMLGLEDLLDRRPAALSGGQRQRVAIGRAMVRNPAAFLFDEPLSNLDAQLRAQMRIEIKKLHQRLGTTIVYVTHDQVEAMTMADRIVVMRDGKVLQIGRPIDLYEHPADVFTARFIGSPSMNMIEGNMRDGLIRHDNADLPIELDRKIGHAGRVLLGVRPHDLHVTDGSPRVSGERGLHLHGTVSTVEPLGAETLVHLDLAEGSVIATAPGRTLPAIGEKLSVHAAPESLYVFDAESEKAL
ncbi:ABC transporter ATP-binding protein [Pararhizobium mangrovi]|uniref:sn-glycerol-3-phosphate ABC transporter ATP-binding protein UgpC n=1 Tax=Pararhizobium mangrovi TaxID=2590452 RepID=A0A506U111_9HYPH|nr:sn-glycerol-3-phosphate ABC transporter ATP-binding protein UgpC [Pararhizobium mangrovi]TPW27178.1 sn-glycerol-3-phosphate ABC transporter ATP-binding protein UgpC [Pararhizobium mangrovi]